MFAFFIAGDFISLFVPRINASKNSKSAKANRANDNRDSEVSSPSDDFDDFEYDGVFDDDDFDPGAPKDSYNIDLSQTPDDESMDGILSKEEHSEEAQSSYIPAQKKQAKVQRKKELGIIDLFTNPSAIFESPPYDVTKRSRGGRVHVSFCTS